MRMLTGLCPALEQKRKEVRIWGGIHFRNSLGSEMRWVARSPINS